MGAQLNASPCWRALEVMTMVYMCSCILPECQGNRESFQSFNSLIRGARIQQQFIQTQLRELKQEEDPLPKGKISTGILAYQFEVGRAPIISAPSVGPSDNPTDTPSPPPTHSPTPQPPTALPTSESATTVPQSVPYVSGELLMAIAQQSSEPSTSPAPHMSIEFSDEGIFLPFLPEGSQQENQAVDEDVNREPNLQKQGNETEQGGDDQGGEPGQQSTVEGETDGFLPAQTEYESTSGSTYYYVDLRPFSLFVEADRDISSDLGVPLYLLLEMEESLANLVDIKISNLTIQSGIMNRTPPALRVRHADYQHNHVHWNQIFFQGVAEFEDSVAYPSETVQNVQSLVLSNKAGLQEFWDSQGRGGTYDNLELVNTTILPFSNEGQQDVTNEQTTPPEAIVSEEPSTQAQNATSYPEPESERPSNVWILVSLALVFLMVCFCIIGLCGRLHYLSSRAQERYNEKYGLDYNVYDKDISKDIFKEEYLMSEHEPEHSHSGYGLSDSLRSIDFMTHPMSSIKAARMSSNNVSIKAPTDEMSIEEEEKEMHVSHDVGAVRKVAPDKSQIRHEEPMVPPLQSFSRSIVTPSQGGSAREVFSDELEDDQGLAPPTLPREEVGLKFLDIPEAPAEGARRDVAEPDLLNLTGTNGALMEPKLMKEDADAQTNGLLSDLMSKNSSTSLGSLSSSSAPRLDIKQGLGSSSARERSFRKRTSFDSTGEDKSAVVGNSSGKDRSTRSNRSIRSVSSASSLGSFHSCNGDLV